MEVKSDALASSPFQPITLSWDFGDGETSTAWSPVHNYTASGTFLAVVTTTDGHGYIDTDQAIIVVYPVTELTISSNATSRIAGDAVHSNSTINSDRNDLLYRWDFGDGGYSAETDPNHTFEKAGTYNVVCSVQDERGGMDRVQCRRHHHQRHCVGRGHDVGDRRIGSGHPRNCSRIELDPGSGGHHRDRPHHEEEDTRGAYASWPGTLSPTVGPPSSGRFCPKCGKAR